jgi:hypothetical protein
MRFPLSAAFLISVALASVTSAADVFPKPNPEKAFPDFKIYDRQGRP